MNQVKQEFLSPSPPPPAIRDAMAKAVERQQKGLPVFDFSSGNVGNLPLNQAFFSKVEFAINQNLPKELTVLAEGLKEGLTGAYHPQPLGLAYSPTGGTAPIKSLVIRYFREIQGVPLSDADVDKVIVTAGGQQAMTASLRSLKPGVKVLLSRWEYAPVSDILSDHNVNEVRIEVNEDLTLNVHDLEKKVGRGSALYISMPNNPTGYFSPKDFKMIMEIMSTSDGGVIWDAPYIFTVLKTTPKDAKFDKAFLQEKLSELKRITEKYHQYMCILSSLSKTCLIAGLRVGFATASAHWIENMNAIIGRENLSSPTPSFIVGAAVLQRFLNAPICHEWLCRILASRLTVLMQEIPDHLLLPRNGMFGALYVMVKTSQEATKVAGELIKEHGIVTVAGNQFYGGSVNAVRLSLVSVPWTEGDEAWIKSVRAIKKALA